MRDLEKQLGALERGKLEAKIKHRVSYRQLQRLAGLSRLGKGLPMEVERDSWLTLMFVVVDRGKSHRCAHFQIDRFILAHKTDLGPPRTRCFAASMCILAKYKRR